MGQRLLRRLCEKCKKKITLEAGDAKKLEEAVSPIRDRFSVPEQSDYYAPGSCDACNGTGYKGRIGVYEVFEVTRAMEELIMKSASVTDIKDLAIKEGMVTMLQDGYLKMIQGITSLEEVRRVLG